MLTVQVVASSGFAGEELRRLVQSEEVRVEDGNDLVESTEARDDDDSVGSGFSRIPQRDVLLFADEPAFERWRPQAGETSPAIVVLGGGSKVIARLRALDVPGWAVLPPDVDGDALHAALEAAAAGLAVVPATAAGGDDPFLEPLTLREQEVLNLMADGCSNKAVAGRLGISEHTAKFHVASVLAKLGAANRADAVRRGIRRGLVSV
jgi:DNA-binding NarL/FixJ family response regulator